MIFFIFCSSLGVCWFDVIQFRSLQHRFNCLATKPTTTTTTYWHHWLFIEMTTDQKRTTNAFRRDDITPIVFSCPRLLFPQFSQQSQIVCSFLIKSNTQQYFPHMLVSLKTLTKPLLHTAILASFLTPPFVQKSPFVVKCEHVCMANASVQRFNEYYQCCCLLLLSLANQVEIIQ